MISDIAACAQLEQRELFDVKRGGVWQRPDAGCQGENRVGPVTPVTPKMDTRGEPKEGEKELTGRLRGAGEARARNTTNADRKDRRPAHSGR